MGGVFPSFPPGGWWIRLRRWEWGGEGRGQALARPPLLPFLPACCGVFVLFMLIHAWAGPYKVCSMGQPGTHVRPALVPIAACGGASAPGATQPASAGVGVGHPSLVEFGGRGVTLGEEDTLVPPPIYWQDRFGRGGSITRALPLVSYVCLVGRVVAWNLGLP